MPDRDSLAVDFFLLAHDPFDNGRLGIHPEILGCGLVGAKLADLVLIRRMRVGRDGVVALGVAAPEDEIDSYVIEAVRSQGAVHSVRSWIEALQDDLYELIAERVMASGTLRREQGMRRLGRARQPDRFPPVDLLTANAPQYRLEQMLRTPKEFTLATGTLVALMSTLGMDGTLVPDVERTTVKEIVTEIADNLPTDLRAVYDAIHAIASEASLRLR